jgi:hypothetical protein
MSAQMQGEKKQHHGNKPIEWPCPVDSGWEKQNKKQVP